MKYIECTENFLNIEPEFSDENAEIVILSVPYEHTVSYGAGTKQGPKAILEASAYVEFFDDETTKELCFEKGIATLEEFELEGLKDKPLLDKLEQEVKNLVKSGKKVVVLGGEHTISSAPIKAHFDCYEDFCVLQIDAHSDLRDDYEGSRYSHASVMARVCEFLPPSKLHQVGIRALCKEEYSFIIDNSVQTYFSSGIRTNEYGQDWIKALVSKLNKNIYLTFDVDGLDPSIMPSTGTPEPDGLSYSESINIVREIKRQNKNIVGLDIVELAPQSGLTHPDILTARLLYKILNLEYYA